MILSATDKCRCRRSTNAQAHPERTVHARNEQSGAMARVANRTRAVLSQERRRSATYDLETMLRIHLMQQ